MAGNPHVTGFCARPEAPKRIWLLIFPLVFSLALTSGCANKSINTLEIAGSTSVAPLISALGEAYCRERTNIRINIQAVGSSAGIQAVKSHTANLGISSRDLHKNEEALASTALCMDLTAVIIHPENPVRQLSSKQLAAIFKGEIQNWKEVAGEDAPIVVISREAGSGSRDSFEEQIGLSSNSLSLLKKSAIIADSNGAVIQNVASKKNAVGYVSGALLNEGVKAVKIDVALERMFLLITERDASLEAQDFIRFIKSDEGIKIIGENGYAPINAPAYTSPKDKISM